MKALNFANSCICWIPNRPHHPSASTPPPPPAILTPAAFAHQLGFQPDPKQAALLAANPHDCILNCSRQWGKSSVTAIKAVHHAFFHPDCLILVLSPSLRQSAEFMRKIKAFLRKLKLPTRSDGENQHSVVLPNLSRIVGLPSHHDTIRGFSAVSLLLIDEAARVPDELYHAVSPMLAVSNGGLWLLSTPNGRQGFFYQSWIHPDPACCKISIPAADCPRISSAFLARERARMGDRLFRQEYACQFLEPEDAALSLDIIRHAFRDDLEPLNL